MSDAFRVDMLVRRQLGLITNAAPLRSMVRKVRVVGRISLEKAIEVRSTFGVDVEDKPGECVARIGLGFDFAIFHRWDRGLFHHAPAWDSR